MQLDDHFYLMSIHKLAAKRVYKRFKVNAYELGMLGSLSAYLLLHDKRIINRKMFTDWLGCNYWAEKKAWNYLFGLVNKGCLHRLAYNRPDGNCLAISPFGVGVLDYFEVCMTFYCNRDKSKRSKLTYKDIILNANELPKGYTIKQMGRMT